MSVYAQINDKGIVIGLSDLHEEVNHPLLIPLSEYNHDLLGCHVSNGEFKKVAVADPEQLPQQKKKWWKFWGVK